MKRIAHLMGLSGLFGAVAWSAMPTPARACGGTFCDGGAPQPMPVDQSGENILFALEGDNIAVHIQIQYEGDPDKFGWVVPLLAVPDRMGAGSQALFDNVLAGSVPTFGFTTQFDDCSLPDNDNGQGLGTAAAGEDGGGSGGFDDDGADGGPTVVVQERVGAFEISVLEGGTADGVVQWLDENGYQQDEQAIPILQQYLDEGHVFAAVKLTAGAGIDEIHPIVFEFRNDEPCVPLRLTSIAAVEDMAVRTFFLSDARVAPRSYRHVLINQLKIDWPNLAANYVDVVTMAVDAESADGRAFVTEYAGTSAVVSTTGIFDDRWDSDVFRTLEAVAVVDQLEAQGLWSCDLVDPETFEPLCDFTHPLLAPMMAKYVPVPDGVAAGEFYDCLECFAAQIDTAAWNAELFADELEGTIFDPGRRAVEMLGRHDYLTRMYTTISPGEMTVDPQFHQNRDLPDVSNQFQATQRVLCSSDSIWTLPDGREVFVPAGNLWPDFDDAQAGLPDEPERMPFAENVSDVGPQGAPMALLDNAPVIDAKLRAYNDALGWDGGPVPQGGSADNDSEGCGCTMAQPGAGMFLTMLGLGLGTIRRRRQ